MDFRKTQIGCMLEQMKLAMLAHIPVIYIPTDQMELIHEILYSDNTIDSLVPRVKYDSEKKAVVKLADKEYGVKDDEKRTFSSIKDNYLIFVNSIDSDVVRCPSILLTYTTKWDKVETGIRNFISDYMGMKRSKDNNPNPYHVANISRSLCIVVTPTEQVIPENIAPYVMTVRVPALLDEEIEAVIASEFNAESMDISVLRRSEVLYSQMIVSLRGFSVLRIRQLLRQMIASQSIDFNHVNADAVLAAIRVSKKQMLENCNGLKWEETNATNAAGLDSISKWLEERIDIFSDPERAAQCHTDIPNGLLISGIPGSGKSLMAKTAAYKLGLPLISLDMGALLNSLMGESEHNMINALRMSENMAPCVLWIDEIEKAFSGSSQNSSSSDGGVGRRMFGKFLTWMQEKTAACFVFATSNDITCLPPELFRSERFDRKYFTFMPKAEECAQIFASNIKAQNKSYREELEAMPVSKRAKMAQQLFATNLERDSFWLDIINQECTASMDACHLKLKERNDVNESEKEDDVYVWSSSSRPKNKLMTGADISALIKEAKFLIRPLGYSDTIQTVIYGEYQMKNAVEQMMRSRTFKPYGETNLKDIVRCFLKLHENEFVPASGTCILDFERYDEDKCIYRHNPASDRWPNPYDQVLYYTIVGAINQYAKNL